MDKNNKYYEIIENLVKNHKKFEGCEAILDDIIEDVYTHSEVILNSVNNESVIISYLQKVVTTSIITVPKKLGFNRAVKHAVISPNLSNIVAAQPAENLLSEEFSIEREKTETKIDTATETETELTDSSIYEPKPEKRANTEFVDKMINLAEDKDVFLKEETSSNIDFAESEELFADDLREEELINENPSVELNNEEDLTESEELEIPVPEEIQEDFQQDELKSEETDQELFLPEEKENEADLSESDFDIEVVAEEETAESSNELHEEEQNDVSDESEILDIDEFQDESKEISLDIQKQPEELLEIKEENITEEDSLDGASASETEEIFDLEELSPNEEEEYIVQDENVEKFILEEDDTNNQQETELNNTLFAEDDSLDSNSLNEFISEEEELVPVNLDDNLLADNTIENDLTLSDDEEFLLFEENDTDKTSENTNIVKTDFSVFNFENSKEDESDLIEIGNDISQLDTKYPNDNIKAIFNLKYKENKAVEEIAVELGIKKSDVISALTKIIDVV